MLKKILSYGTIAGLTVGIPLSAITIGYGGRADAPHSLLLGYTIMLVALSAVFVGIKRHRDLDLGGVIRFWPAFLVGLGISFVAGVFYVVAWEASLAIAHLDFASGYANFVIEQQKAKGVSGEALAKVVAQMEEFKANYANPAYRVSMTFVEIFPVGVLVSLISAGLLRNSRFLPARRA